MKRGDQVICLDDLSRGSKDFVLPLGDSKRFLFCQGDASDAETLRKVFGSYKPNAIIQLAANSDIRSSSPDLEYGETMLTTFRLLQAAKEFGVKNFFMASTSAVYGENRESDEKDVRHWCDAHTEMGPISYYGAAKMASEAWVDAFSYMEGIKSAILRFPNVVGPHMTHGVIKDFVDRLREDPTKLEMLGDGSQEKSYIYVSDLVSAILMAIDRRCWRLMDDGDVERDVVCAPDGGVTVRMIAYEAIGALGLCDVHISSLAMKGMPNNVGWKGDVSHFEYDCSEFRRRFPSWMPEHTGIGAVRQAVRDYVKETGGPLSK
jgi:UDP-glucose 4-epimerase